MASKMKTDQTAEIAQMRAARLALTGKADSPPPPPDPTQERAMAMMKTLSGAALDRMFLMDMIQHHATALPAAHRAMPFLKRMDLQMLAERIVDAQAEEVGDLKEMLGELTEADHPATGSTDGGPQADAGAPGGEDTQLVGDRRVPYTPPNELGFTDFFIVHHEMAIKMADLVIAKGADAEVKTLATTIKTTQTKEIADMKAVRRELRASESPTPAPPDPLMVAEMARMQTLAGAALDRMFLEEMIPHHAAGVPTAHRSLAHLRREDMRELARDIFNAQADEIGDMHDMLEQMKGRDGGAD
jgi:uncharacterized protein (DUF305 family)